jgi:hypothetical protein
MKNAIAGRHMTISVLLSLIRLSRDLRLSVDRARRASSCIATATTLLLGAPLPPGGPRADGARSVIAGGDERASLEAGRDPSPSGSRAAYRRSSRIATRRAPHLVASCVLFDTT